MILRYLKGLKIAWKNFALKFLLCVLVLTLLTQQILIISKSENAGSTTVSNKIVSYKHASVLEAWPEGSDLNVSSYIEIEPQFIDYPKRRHNDTEILILVTSAPENVQGRKSIRKTWGATENQIKYKTEVNFVLGISNSIPTDLEHEIETFEDILTINVIDSYMNLTLKSVFLLKYVSDIHETHPNIKTLLKTDDDCYVNLANLGHVSRQNQRKNTITGALLNSNGGKRIPVNRKSNDKWFIPRWMYKSDHFPLAISGSGYLFATSIASCLYKMSLKTPILVLEDIYVTGLLAKKCQVTLKSSLGFLYMGIQDYCDVKPDKDVVIHRIDIEKMHDRVRGVSVMNQWGFLEPFCP